MFSWVQGPRVWKIIIIIRGKHIKVKTFTKFAIKITEFGNFSSNLKRVYKHKNVDSYHNDCTSHLNKTWALYISFSYKIFTLKTSKAI